MTSILNVANSIGKETVQKMKELGIDSLEKLATSRIEDLLVIDGINVSKARTYIYFAKKHIETIRAKEKIYNIINKAGTSKALRKKSKIKTPKQIDKKSNLSVPISSIKKLADSSIDNLSKIKGMPAVEAQRYIEIAKKYLESMRKKEASYTSSLDSNLQNQVLGFIKFENKTVPQKLKPIIPSKQKKASILVKPTIDLKSIKKHVYEKEVKPKPTTPVTTIQPESKTFFPLETMQKIRFFHFKIKNLEVLLEKNEDFSFSELNNVIQYIKILNINYKTQSQIRIFKELEITPSFYDPIAKREIKIWDLIFECSRVLWIAARAYLYLSNRFEQENLMENAIVAMVECSKMYKTAAYFSAACTRQEDKGIALSVENLELNSEESRIFAQNLATFSEEARENFGMAANLSSGLSALTKRLTFLRRYEEKKENQLKAQYHYDMGRACHLKAKSLLKESSESGNEEKRENMRKKSNYYYIKAEEIWESMLKSPIELTDLEKENIITNLSIVNENIIDNDVEIISEKEALKIQDPEPLIIVPENLAPFIPRTTNFLTQYKQVDLNFDAYKRYKNIISEVLINFNKIEELQNNKAGIGRTLKQLRVLYDNNDIDINSFTELFEKYSIKLETIEAAIQNLKNPESKNKRPEEQKKILKSIM